ncbi:uncharacterized protein TNCT_200681 [Trichonephila clavata]|uniref:Uncharacterized protein n=1 Tax=Trichonephila clavata TaxID=2740835 RepID=A0A8X6F771_TRICU|nr:uncharacterized protein TNCT_200681 [Trichonephila clavata]
MRSKEKGALQMCVAMEFFDNHNVLSLRQMAMTNLAITVCRDPEILDFVKGNGCSSFVFPSKETHLYLEVKSPVTEIWVWKDFLMEEIVTNLYVTHERRNEANEPDDCVTRKNVLPFVRWEGLVEERISSFLLPQLLQHELLDVVRSVSIEIEKWIKDHFLFLKRSADIAYMAQCHFQWDSIGKVDRLKTANKLIMNEGLYIEDRYILAVHYGLMQKISMRENVLGEIVEKYENLPWRGARADNVWREFIGEGDCSYIAQQNFFTRSSSEQKVLCLNAVLSKESLQFNEFLFYLSQMEDEERKEVFKTHAFKILEQYFLDWPLQCKFLEAAEQLVPYFSESNFRNMLRIILFEKIMLRRKDFNYIHLLKGFWSMSSSQLKESIKTDSIYEPLMFTINFPVSENFPNEQLFKSYNGDCLTFGCCGIEYCLFREEKIYKNWFLSKDFLFCFHCRFVNAFVFGKEHHHRCKRERKIFRKEYIFCLGAILGAIWLAKCTLCSFLQ